MATDELVPVLVPTDDLIPYERNARTHSDTQVKMIAESIKQFGFNNPVLIDDARTILAGHGRVLAARKLGLERVPCVVLGHMTAAQKRAYILADNRLAERAGWDRELVKLELSDLAADGFDVELTGFDADELLADLDTEQQISGDMQYKVIVHCTDESHQAAVLSKLESEGLSCQALIA